MTALSAPCVRWLSCTTGGHKNPYLDVKMEPLGLSPAEVDAIVAFLETLEGQGYQDKAPQAFPQ